MAEVLNIASLMKRIGGDREFLANMLELYDKDRIELISQMHAALLNRDGGALADAAHTLGGLARNFSAEPAADAALTLEEMAEKGEFAIAGEAIASLEDETDRLRAALQDMLQQESNSSAGDKPQRASTPTAEHPIRVVTVDDQELVRSGIRFILEAYDDMELVGEASSGAEGLRLCEELRPDVVLMDMRMPNMDGAEATRTIRTRYPGTKVLFLSVYHNRELVTEAMHAGATGYVMKDASRDELVGAIRAVRKGRTTLSAEAATDLVEQVASSATVIGDDLTARERQVLGMLAKGMRNNQIAKEINKSPYTVRHYVSEIIAKLGARNRAEAAAIAVKCGLVE